MSEPLYTLDILRLAAASGDFPRLATADATAERRATTCGSRIIVDLAFDAEGRVAAYGHEVRACALGQAAATLFARHAVGKKAAELEAAQDGFARWLVDSEAENPDWPGIEALERARGYPARHGAMRLAFEAAADAATQVPA
jgi:NifU-like protein involved in Fe-S cluster formation